MKLTLGQIYQGYPVISKIITHDMPIRTAFSMSRMAKTINDEYTEVEAQRVKLIQKFGEKADDEKMQVKPDKYADFAKEFNELLGEEVEVEINQISLNQLPEDLKLTPQDAAIIDFLIEPSTSSIEKVKAEPVEMADINKAIT